MKKILSAALLVAEILASIWTMDFAFSFMSQPSDWMFVGGLGLLFMVGAFWYYRFQVMRHRRATRREQGDDNDTSKSAGLLRDPGDTLHGWMRDANWPWKRRHQG